MGGAQSHPPNGYVLQYFAIGQQVNYRSQYGYDVPCTVVQFTPPYHYGLRQHNGDPNRIRPAFAWQLTALGPPPAVSVPPLLPPSQVHGAYSPAPPPSYNQTVTTITTTTTSAPPPPYA